MAAAFGVLEAGALVETVNDEFSVLEVEPKNWPWGPLSIPYDIRADLWITDPYSNDSPGPGFRGEARFTLKSVGSPVPVTLLWEEQTYDAATNDPSGSPTNHQLDVPPAGADSTEYVLTAEEGTYVIIQNIRATLTSLV